MNNRSYRFILGLVLLLACYFDWRQLIYGIIIVVVFEGVTNLRLPFIVNAALPESEDREQHHEALGGGCEEILAHLP